MKAMIWKELRENARWAALGGLGLFLAEIFTLTGGRAVANEAIGVTLCSGSFLLASMFGCAVVGAALGALQILPERRRDQWASLLHRPVPRRVIFLGKVAAGLLLYALATGLPLLACTLYVACSGRVPAPFAPGLLRPALSDLLLGGAFYFCALLVGLHAGRWWGARGAIVASAVLVLAAHSTGEWLFLLPLLAMAVFFTAAWGAMQGDIVRRPLLSRWALGSIVLLGLGGAFLTAGLVLQALARPAYSSSFYTDFYIAHDGTVFIQKTNVRGGTEIRDFEGKTVTDERYVGDGDGNGVLYPVGLIDRETGTGFGGYGSARSSRGRVEMLCAIYESPELWYRLGGPQGYFIGYDRLSARCVGICDAEGFKSAGAVPKPFVREPQGEMNQTPPHLYAIGSQIFSIDFAERRMSLLADLGSERILGAAHYPERAEHRQTAVALGTEIRVFGADGAALFSVPYTHDAKSWPDVSIISTEDFHRTFIRYTANAAAARGTDEATNHLEVYDAQGHRLAAYAQPSEFIVAQPNTWASYLACALSPPSLMLGVDALQPASHRTLTAGEARFLLAVAVIYAGLAVVWGRRIGLTRGRMTFWAVLALIFGLCGLLAYRLATAWPACVRCPQCGRPRPVTDRACPRCQKAWEALPASGTEIFEGV